MARAWEVAGLDCDEPYALAAARVVEVRAVEVVGNSRDVLDLEDVERVHDMRVSTRRLRAALEIFAPCFPKKPLKRATKEVRALADALGERRDPDVAIEDLRRFGAAAGPGAEEGVDLLLERLRVEQAAANERLADLVTPARLGALLGSIGELVQAAVEEARPRAVEEPAGARAGSRNGGGGGEG
jgi:CHAD domain-containing protein